MLAAKNELFTRPSGGYTIARSVRTRASASAYFNRTPAGAGNRKTWTWSAWVKRGTLSSGYPVLFMGGATQTDTGATSIALGVDDKIYIQGYNTNWLVTSQVFRDPSAWYHIVVAMDSTNATANNRLRLYVNGVEVTAFSTRNNLTLNTDYGINQAALHCIAFESVAFGSNYFDGYLTEINFVDGQQLTPSSFGETDSITGVWKPKAYSGTYGTNGFYLNFSDNSNNTAATIGKDYSGNGNNWTPNNINVTAYSGTPPNNVSYDSMVDSPTVGSLSSNYAVLNPLAKALSNGGTGTTSNGNLTIAFGATNWYGHKGSIAVSSGKWYYEVVNTSGTNFVQAGFTLVTVESETATGVYRYRSNGNKVSTGYTAYGAAWNSAGDIAGVAFDADTGEITFYKNGVSQGSAFTSIPAGLYAPEVIVETGTTANVNFGQRPFSYTPPTGFVALNTYNLPASTIKNGAAYMAATIWTGDSASPKSFSNAVNGVSFQPDFVWIKNRSNNYFHNLYDSVRGTGSTKNLISNGTYSEGDSGYAALYGFLSAFNSDGFQTTNGTDASPSIWVNQSGQNFVAWQWKAGGTATTIAVGSVSSGVPSIASSVSANTTAGFSVVTYTGNGSTATVGHGLGVAPNFIIVKSRTSSVDNWQVYHASLGNTQRVTLNTTNAADSPSPGMWNSTSPTSTVFSVGNQSGVNSATTYVAYCFSAVAGYSAFGSYTGNGSADGPFIYTGFRPSFFLTKRTDSTSDWIITDNKRDTYNVPQNELYADLSNAESTATRADFLSNGFKVRGSGAANNASGGTYIYMAFAENPFKNSLAR